jgi:squalene-associated FAD-dependent desaturase
VTPHVIVIGAGFAGIAAAVALSKAGKTVLLIEARGQLGGRATSLTDRVTGEAVDNGQHVLFGCYRETLALLAELGQREAVYVQPALHVPFIGPDGIRRDLKCADLPSPLNLAAGLLRWTALDTGDRIRAARLFLSLWRGREPRADETVTAWLVRAGQTRRLRGWLWEPLAIAALNESPDVASARMFAAVLRELFGGHRQDASLVLPRVPLSALYAVPARTYLEARGSAVRLGRPARVSRHGDAFTVRAGDDRWHAPWVIATVPWHAIATLFDGGMPPELESVACAAAAMRPVPIVTVNLWYDRQVLEPGDVPLRGLVGRTAQWVFDRRAIAGDTASHVSVITSAASGLSERTDASIIEVITRDLADALPLAAGAVVRRATVVREKQATFSLRPGSPVRPREQTPLKGLLLAGDWLHTGLPGTIEGAVRSGNRAAYLCDPSSFTTTK